MEKHRHLELPDPAERDPAEGGLLTSAEEVSHLCCPEMEPSSELPVEGGALWDRKKMKETK